MIRSIYKVYPFAMALLLLLTVPASGKVFRLFGGGGDAFHNGSLPWDTAYVTQMTVNGRPAKVKIYSARYTEPAPSQLKARFEAMGAKVQMTRSADGGAAGRAVFPDQNVGFLVIRPPKEPIQQIIVYEPTGKQGNPAKMPIPEFSRATVRTTVSDDETGTYLATLDSSASATEAHSFYARSMQGAGWKLVSPALIKNGTVTGMAVYEKKSKICYIQATDRIGGSNSITLLVKGGAL